MLYKRFPLCYVHLQHDIIFMHVMTECKLEIGCALFKMKQASSCATLSLWVHSKASAQQYHGLPFQGQGICFLAVSHVHSYKEVDFKQCETNVIVHPGLF